ncbi:ABC transporter ATP-binding protein [Ferruginibacter sp. HRS2-29]|uniref:ABC transporter ATP-binding protein n=1 Tax=Ferruginibacter sp. HRS2-29 TaxID=2487334 RepID=UPI0020CF4CEC|nr:ABC transporter ATP-binding protein [Ferruginibacter sp. HRS2-29]MCP9751297.1 ABC transporter ATP-binding protein [Ferruginibacter sp. HRS2-29]
MSVLLEVKNLSKNFDGFQAVNDLSFTVNEGDVYGFLGQNGAGKSTTIRMLLTLIKPTSGKIIFFGKNLAENRGEVLRMTGAVVERPDLYKYLSAYDNLYIFAKMSGVKTTRKLIMDQLELVGLAERARSKVKTFSQGMKQRLGIAVALIHDPKLIILDEPTNGLDPQGIADMRNLILHLSRELGKTVIVSSHLLSEIEQIANRMIIINKGKKIVEGVVSELLDPAKTVVELETLDNAAAFDLLKTSSWSGGLELSGKYIRLHMDKADIPALARQLSASGVGILSLQPRHSLEDYFLSLTNAENHVEPVTN